MPFRHIPLCFFAVLKVDYGRFFAVTRLSGGRLMGFAALLEKRAETVALPKESESYVLSRGYCKED